MNSIRINVKSCAKEYWLCTGRLRCNLIANVIETYILVQYNKRDIIDNNTNLLGKH